MEEYQKGSKHKEIDKNSYCPGCESFKGINESAKLSVSMIEEKSLGTV